MTALVDDTRAARTQRYARIHLTFCARGCEQLPPEHPGRNRVFWGQPEIQVLRAVLTRLQLSPGQVRVRTEDPPLHEVHLMAEIDGLDCPVASLCEGFTPELATELLHQLEAQGWFPMPTRLPQLEKAA